MSKATKIEPGVAPTPQAAASLSTDALTRIDAWWRAANYRSGRVVQDLAGLVAGPQAEA